MPRAQIKDEDQYQALRRDGASKEKAARIANASAGSSRSKVGRKGGKASDYDEMTKKQLYDRAKQIGIQGRSSMDRGQLIKALRNH